MTHRLLAIATGLLYATPAAADPIITPLVITGLTAAGIEAGAAVVGTLTVGALVTSVVEIGIVAGASLLLTPKRKTKQDPAQPQQPTLQAIGAQSISPRYYGAGRIMAGGVNHWKECLDGNHMLEGVILNCEPIDGIDAWLIDGQDTISWQYGAFQQLTSFYSGTVQTVDCGPNVQWPNDGMKWAFQYSNYWTGVAWQSFPVGYLPAMVFDFRNGLPGGNPSTLAAAYLPTLYDSNHKCCNLACVYAMALGGPVILNRMGTYPRAWPQMSWVIRATTIYDPRDAGQTFDGSLIAPFSARDAYLAWYFGQKATWAWSRNSILVLAWYMTHYDGGRIHPSKIDWASFSTEADYCDRPVTVYGGGTEPWARTDVQWHASEEVRDVLARLQAACDATIWEDGDGLWKVWIFKNVAPTVTLTDDDISSIEIAESAGALAEFNHLTPSYMEPRENYQMIPAAPITDDESISLVGERAETASFNEVASFNQVHRLAWRMSKRQNPAMKLTIVGGPSLLRCVGEKVIAIDSEISGVTGTFRFAKRAEVDPKLNQITLSLALVSADDYDDVVPPYDPVSPYETTTVPAPNAVTISSPDQPALVEVDVSGDKYIRVSATIGGNTPGDTSYSFYCEGRRVDSSTHAPLGSWLSFSNLISQWVRESDIVTIGYTYEVHGYFVQNGVPSPMSGSSFITIV